MTETTSTPPTKRIEYIDALRGFTMILVVLTHVATFCIDLEGIPKYHTYLRQFRMPLFFSLAALSCTKKE